MSLYDIHTHRRPTRPDVVSILNVMVDEDMTSLPDAQPCSVGMHPWTRHDDVEKAWERCIALARQPSVVAIGEAGLDRNVDTPWDEQMEIFRRHIALSEEFGKPLVVHCVRAYDDVIQERRRREAEQAWIIHGFNKGGDVMDRLIDAGCHLSFGEALLKERSPARAAIVRIPFDRFVLETDDGSVGIEDVYVTAATLRGTTPEGIEAMVSRTVQYLFPQLAVR